MRLFIGAADQYNPVSLASKLRHQRHAFFMKLVGNLPKPVRVLDVGGREIYWRQMGIADTDCLQIVLLNLKDTETTLPNISGLVGDATQMPQFGEGEFDVVFSNSVIEHLYNWDAQLRMAKEVRRVGKAYFVQTPNRYFPIEPHFHVPLLQFMPLFARKRLLRSFALGHNTRELSEQEADRMAREIRLLSRREMKMLFPDADLYEERVAGWLKSFVAYWGWNCPAY